MPAKNTVKQYLENGVYHVYNRGVEKRLIFMDKQDYSVFLGYLKGYLLPKDEKFLKDQLVTNTDSKNRDKILKLLRLRNFSDNITLLAYSLMPNHFHFLLKQKGARSINSFMQSLATRYTMYFNFKYKRIGSLFQAVYKAVLVDNENQLLNLTRYIHRQSLASLDKTLHDQPSSYPEYLGKKNTKWIKSQEILSFFSKNNPLLNYRTFVENSENLKGFEDIKDLLIEKD